MSVKIRTRTGKTVVLLNPSEKGKKYSNELKTNFAKTNDGHFKLDKRKKAVRLTEEQRAFRAGYLAHSKDSANCFKAKQKKRRYS